MLRENLIEKSFEEMHPGLEEGVWVSYKGENDKKLEGILLEIREYKSGTNTCLVLSGKNKEWLTPWWLEVLDRDSVASKNRVESLLATREIKEAGSGLRNFWEKVDADKAHEIELRISDPSALIYQRELEEYYKLKLSKARDGSRAYGSTEARDTIWRRVLNDNPEILTVEYLEAFSDYLAGRVNTLYESLGRPVLVSELLGRNDFFKTHLESFLSKKVDLDKISLCLGESDEGVREVLASTDADIVFWVWPPDVCNTEEDILSPVLESDVSELILIGNPRVYSPERTPFGFPVVRRLGPGARNEPFDIYSREQAYPTRLSAAGFSSTIADCSKRTSTDKQLQQATDCQYYDWTNQDFRSGRAVSQTVSYRRNS